MSECALPEIQIGKKYKLKYRDWCNHTWQIIIHTALEDIRR